MKIYFVRHGHPDCKSGNLTELGHKQAEMVAERLKDCGVERIFASTMSRARQTAEYTAKILGLDITLCDFMREISWKSLDGGPIPENGHPWNLSSLRASMGESLFIDDWQTQYPYCNSEVVESVNKVSFGIDEWLLKHGYKREGDYYRVVGGNTDTTMAIFSHAGSSSAALSHILNIPFPQFCGAFCPDFTSVTVINLSNELGRIIYPEVILFNDARHISGLTSPMFFAN